jgi:hypothetical protein
VVSAAAIAALSLPLNRLINGPRKEAEEKCAAIVDVEKEVFTRLCEYAYRGDYTVPAWTGGISGENGSANTKSTVRRDSVDEDLQSTRDDEKKLTLQERFNDKPYISTTLYKHELNVGYRAMANTRHDHNFQSVFLGHAKLYLLADKYLIEGLKNLVLYKLRSTLQMFELYECRVVDIVELVRFSYTNDYTSDRSDNGELDELRRLVVEYVILHRSKIDSSKVFEEILEEGGQFVVDYYRLIKEQYIGAECEFPNGNIAIPRLGDRGQSAYRPGAYRPGAYRPGRFRDR